MHRASWRRRPGEERGRALLDPPQLVTNVGRELELFRLDRALQTIAQLSRAGDVRQLRRQRGHIAASDVPRIAVDTSQQIAQTHFERFVAVRAPEPAGGAEIGE